MPSRVAGSEIVIGPTPNAHFGAGVVGKLPGIVRGLGCDAVVVVTDAALAATPVVARVTGALEAAPAGRASAGCQRGGGNPAVPL